MNTSRYRKDFNKVFRKIDRIAQKGVDGTLEYKQAIDEFISSGLYRQLEDVLFVKYGIDISKAITIQDIKNNTFADIRRITNYDPQIFLRNLTEDKGVYSLGQHFYNKENNQYLGDIVEIDRIKDLTRKLLDIFIDVDAVVGSPESIRFAVPIFYDDIRTIISFKIDDQVQYVGNIYHCKQPYVYSEFNRITPTFSTYWDQVLSPSYSLTSFTGSSTTLLQKYSLAIDKLKTYNYTII
jgi:hypothetical protein